MIEFLQSTDVIDWQHPEVRAHAAVLREGLNDQIEITKRCFEWVRDEVRHSRDFALEPVTCNASDVLKERSGYCPRWPELVPDRNELREKVAGCRSVCVSDERIQRSRT